jgi:hypothetical protein
LGSVKLKFESLKFEFVAWPGWFCLLEIGCGDVRDAMRVGSAAIRIGNLVLAAGPDCGNWSFAMHIRSAAVSTGNRILYVGSAAVRIGGLVL